jgi:drug/metabolite transporter (DMT)-like permease
VLAFVAVVVLGATNLVLVAMTARRLPPLWAAGLRFTFAALLTLGLAAALRLSMPRRRDLVVSAIYGLFGFYLAFGLFFWGARKVPAGIASVILGSVPLLTLFLARLHGVERFRVRGLIGAVLAIVGIAVISVEAANGTPPLVPLLAIVGAAAAAAESAVTIRKIPGVHPLPMNAVGMSVGAVLLLFTSFVAGEAHPTPWSVGATTPLLAMIVTSPLLFALYVFVAQRWSASAIAYSLVLFPLVSIPLSALLLDESIGASLLLGAPLVLLGVYIGALAPARRAPETTLASATPSDG